MNYELLTPAEAATLLRSSPSALSNRRMRGVGPAYLRDGRKILYRRKDIDAWLTQTDGRGV